MIKSFDLQIGPLTRSMARERMVKEEQLSKLAEFGCGTGFYTQLLVSKADSLVATDISPGMLALAKERIKAANVTFQMEDCQETSFPDEVFDTTFISLVIHFTEPEKTLAEMRRILKPGGTLIISNLDPSALNGVNRVRCLIRILYHGLTRYRVKPPKGFGKNIITERQLCDLLLKSGFGGSQHGDDQRHVSLFEHPSRIHRGCKKSKSETAAKRNGTDYFGCLIRKDRDRSPPALRYREVNKPAVRVSLTAFEILNWRLYEITHR